MKVGSRKETKAGFLNAFGRKTLCLGFNGVVIAARYHCEILRSIVLYKRPYVTWEDSIEELGQLHGRVMVEMKRSED